VGDSPAEKPCGHTKILFPKFPKLPLNLSTGKVSHWKAKKISLATKPAIRIITGPRENKACN